MTLCKAVEEIHLETRFVFRSMLKSTRSSIHQDCAYRATCRELLYGSLSILQTKALHQKWSGLLLRWVLLRIFLRCHQKFLLRLEVAMSALHPTTNLRKDPRLCKVWLRVNTFAWSVFRNSFVTPCVLWQSPLKQ